MVTQCTDTCSKCQGGVLCTVHCVHCVYCISALYSFTVFQCQGRDSVHLYSAWLLYALFFSSNCHRAITDTVPCGAVCSCESCSELCHCDTACAFLYESLSGESQQSQLSSHKTHSHHFCTLWKYLKVNEIWEINVTTEPLTPKYSKVERPI